MAEAGGPEAWRDWRGLPEDVLVKVAEIFVAQTEAKWAAQLKADGFGGTVVRNIMEWRKREAPSLFVFAMVCKGWRKAQLKINSLRAAQERPRPWPVAPSGPLRTRVESYVILPGRVALAKWALGEGCPREGVNIYRDTGAPGSHHVTMAQAAARFGHLELVRWLVEEQGFEIDDAVVDNAAGSGNLELVQWLWGNEGVEVDKRLIRRATESGHLELVRWLVEEQGFEIDDAVVDNAAGSGNLELVQWLWGNEGVEVDKRLIRRATESGHLELVRWLVEEQGFEIDNAVVDNAAGSGNLELVQWLWDDELDDVFEVDKRLMQRAAKSGHLELVKWLRGKGCDWNAWTFALAAQRGHLEVLEWMHTNGCPMSHITVSFAVQNGNVEVLRWARENGCPWHAEDRDRAAAELGYTDNLGSLFDPNDP